ncbi:hypothetical protein GW17_00050835 [Ensete ventricosum]|nr:hypothetical protein GW17_00050835 [Ensete ventricosum]
MIEHDDSELSIALFVFLVVLAIVASVISVSFVVVVVRRQMRQPAVAMQMAVHANEVFQAPLVGAQPRRCALGYEPRRRHAPHPGAAIGAAHPGFQLRLLPYQPCPRPRPHEPPEHPAVGAQVLAASPTGRRVLAGIADEEQVAPEAAREEGPAGGLGEAGDADKVAQGGAVEGEEACRGGTAAAEEEEFGEGVPPAAEAAGGGHAVRGERGHHARCPGDAQLPEEHAAGHGAEATANAGRHADDVRIPVEAAEHQHQDRLVQYPGVPVASIRSAAPGPSAAPDPSAANARGGGRRAERRGVAEGAALLILSAPLHHRILRRRTNQISSLQSIKPNPILQRAVHVRRKKTIFMSATSPLPLASERRGGRRWSGRVGSAEVLDPYTRRLSAPTWLSGLMIWSQFG